MEYSKPSDSEAERAVNLLIRWIGDNPNREGLINTSKRMLSTYKRFFEGYQVDINLIMQNSVLPNEGCNSMIIFKNTEFTSYCEHHIVPMKGKISSGYIPDKLILSIGKFVKLINYFTKRLQIQERLTMEIAKALDHYLFPKGVIVVVEAIHGCVACCEDGYNNNLSLQTSYATGIFQDNMEFRKEFFSHIN